MSVKTFACLWNKYLLVYGIDSACSDWNAVTRLQNYWITWSLSYLDWNYWNAVSIILIRESLRISVDTKRELQVINSKGFLMDTRISHKAFSILFQKLVQNNLLFECFRFYNLSYLKMN